MELALTTLSQVAALAAMIGIGFLIGKIKLVPENAAAILSKLENLVFLPALMFGTFLSGFTRETLGSVWKLFLGSLILELIVIPIAFAITRLCSKDSFVRNIYMYGLCFANFGFMGNAVVSVLFPEIFLEYSVFTLTLWIFINLWAVPVLLTDGGERGTPIKQRLKAFLNPMMIGMLIGAILGICGVKLPSFASTVVTSLGNCMSPVAMLLTGLTVSRIPLRKMLSVKSIYVVTAIRLLVFPALFLLAAKFLPLDRTFIICALCALAMPLGLNTVVIPTAYGKDPGIAAGMALVSHLLSCLTIPAMLALFEYLF